MKMVLKLFKKNYPPKIEFRRAWTLTLLFCKPRRGLNLRSKLVRLFGRSSYCRVALGFKDFVYTTVQHKDSFIWLSMKRFCARHTIVWRIDIELSRDQYLSLFEASKNTPKFSKVSVGQLHPLLKQLLSYVAPNAAPNNLREVHALITGLNRPEIKVKV